MSSASLRRIAIHALLQVAANPDAPAAARASSSRTILEAIGDLGRGSVSIRDKEARDLTELTPEELQAELEAAAKYSLIEEK